MSYDPGIYRQLADLEERLRRLEAVDRTATASGTWTPTFAGTGTAGTFTYSSQVGFWRRVGDVILVWCDVAISAISVAPTTDMQILGLPVAVVSVVVPAAIVPSNLDYPTGALELTAQCITGGTAIALGYTRDNLGTLNYPAANFTNTSARVRLQAAYLA